MLVGLAAGQSARVSLLAAMRENNPNAMCFFSLDDSDPR